MEATQAKKHIRVGLHQKQKSKSQFTERQHSNKEIQASRSSFSMLNEPESLESGIRHSVDTIDHEKVKHLYAQDKTAEKSSARKMKTNTGTIQNINLVV